MVAGSSELTSPMGVLFATNLLIRTSKVLR
jgi:hypothetical protein